MSAGKFNVTIDQGSDFSLKLTVKEAGVVKNLTGYSARAQLRPTITSSTLTATFTCSITSASAGTLKMELGNTATPALQPGQYYYDLEIYTGSLVQRLVQGGATIRAEVTR